MRHLIFHLTTVSLVWLGAACYAPAQSPVPPVPVDVGNLASDGGGEWNYLVRPLAPHETAPSSLLFTANPLDFPTPPVTPAQASIPLHAGIPLVLVVPNSGGLVPAGLEVTHQIDQHQIDLHITRSYGLGGPAPWDLLGFEYLHPLGPLDAGDYTLNMTFLSTYESSPSTIITGFLPFTVMAIPTPATAGLLIPLVIATLMVNHLVARRSPS